MTAPTLTAGETLRVHAQAVEVTANADDRTLTVLLVPYGEVGNTNAGRIVVQAGDITLPEDPMIVGLNLDHDRSQSLGRATTLWEEPRGIMATYAVAKGAKGDAALADARNPNGSRRAVSGEFNIVLGEFDATTNARRCVPGQGELFGGALVPRGAFDSAQVLAADSSSRYITEYTDADGVTWTRKEETTTTTEETENGTETTSVTTVTETTEGNEMPEPVAVAATAATVPNTLGGAPAAPAGTTAPVNMTAQVLAAIQAVKLNHHDSAALQVLAAITDITTTGAGALAGTNVIRENWLGQLYQGIEYVREYITLGNLSTDISLAGKRGFRVARGNNPANPGAPVDGSYLGNKTPINGYTGSSDTLGSVLYRFATGNDIDRGLFDLPGGVEVVEAFLRLIIEDHLYWSDRIARESWVSAAGAPIALKAYPNNYPGALGQLIQGILAVKKRKSDQRRDTPTFAIANDIAYEQLAYAAGGEQNLPAFVQIALSTDRSGRVDGSVQIVNGDTGTYGSSSVIVGSGSAIDFDEIAGGPLLIDAVDLAKGGIDKATHGYLQVFEKRREAVVHIGATDAWAATTPIRIATINRLAGGAILQAVRPAAQIPGADYIGTTGAAAPAAPAAVGQTVVDGTVTWRRIA